MKVIITGAGGQVGWELQRTVSDDINLVALKREDLDIAEPDYVRALIINEKPDWVINSAAYTAVDKAEENTELVYRINRDGARNIAEACKEVGAKMLQISTDFIFDGAQGTPYQTTSPANPLNVYGASKLAGDEAVLHLLGDDCTIVRTSWVYSVHGNNFVKTMISLMSERTELNIVSDQIGTPTWANGLAMALWNMVRLNINGIQHWTDYGVSGWYDFAMAIYEEGSSIGIINNRCTIKPIRTDQYPVLATRPQYSVLDKSDTILVLECEPEHWRVSLRRMLLELKIDIENE